MKPGSSYVEHELGEKPIPVQPSVTTEQRLRTLLKIILMLFVIEVATSLVMCSIGSLYNVQGSFAEIFKVVMVSLATTTGVGIIILVFALIVYPKTLD